MSRGSLYVWTTLYTGCNPTFFDSIPYYFIVATIKSPNQLLSANTNSEWLPMPSVIAEHEPGLTPAVIPGRSVNAEPTPVDVGN